MGWDIFFASRALTQELSHVQQVLCWAHQSGVQYSGGVCNLGEGVSRDPSCPCGTQQQQRVLGLRPAAIADILWSAGEEVTRGRDRHCLCQAARPTTPLSASPKGFLDQDHKSQDRQHLSMWIYITEEQNQNYLSVVCAACRGSLSRWDTELDPVCHGNDGSRCPHCVCVKHNCTPGRQPPSSSVRVFGFLQAAWPWR